MDSRVMVLRQLIFETQLTADIIAEGHFDPRQLESQLLDLRHAIVNACDSLNIGSIEAFRIILGEDDPSPTD